MKITSLLPCALVLALSACSSTQESARPLGETTRSTAYKEGVPGGVIIETTRLNATVAAIDAAKREVTLAKDGRQKVIGCGPEVINFDQIHVGDRLDAVIKSELLVSLAAADPTKSGTGVVAASLAPKGDKPGGVVHGAQEYTATVTAISQRRREVTLQLPDATTRTIVVRPDVDLTQRKVGDAVSVQVSVSVALSVQGK